MKKMYVLFHPYKKYLLALTKFWTLLKILGNTMMKKIYGICGISATFTRNFLFQQAGFVYLELQVVKPMGRGEVTQ